MTAETTLRRRAAAPEDVAGIAPSPPAEGARVVKPISALSHQLAEYKFTSHFVIAQPGTTPQDLDMHPDAFSLLAGAMQMFDDVRVVDADDLWIADFIVVDCGASFVICRLRGVVERTGRLQDLSDRIPVGYTVRQTRMSDDPSQHGLWLVIRDATKTAPAVCLSGGHFLNKKEDAVRYLMDHASVIGEVSQNVFRKA